MAHDLVDRLRSATPSHDRASGDDERRRPSRMRSCGPPEPAGYTGTSRRGVASRSVCVREPAPAGCMRRGGSQRTWPSRPIKSSSTAAAAPLRRPARVVTQCGASCDSMSRSTADRSPASRSWCHGRRSIRRGTVGGAYRPFPHPSGVGWGAKLWCLRACRIIQLVEDGSG